MRVGLELARGWKWQGSAKVGAGDRTKVRLVLGWVNWSYRNEPTSCRHSLMRAAQHKVFRCLSATLGASSFVTCRTCFPPTSHMLCRRYGKRGKRNKSKSPGTAGPTIAFVAEPEQLKVGAANLDVVTQMLCQYLLCQLKRRALPACWRSV